MVHVEGEFSMGRSYINSFGRILCEDRITIGDDCAIAWNFQLLDSNRHELRVGGDPVQKTAPITVEDDVWIGHDVTIKKGVTVGKGAVIASNSVVTKDVAENTLVGGTPATVLKEDVHWSN